MSYILDALNKSEAERSRRKVEDQLAIHRGPPKTQRRSPLLAFAIIVGCANLAALGWWVLDQKRATPPVANQPAQPASAPTDEMPVAQPQAQNQLTDTHATVATPDAVPPSSTMGLAEGEILIAPEDYAGKAATSGREQPAPIPELEFSSHIYADDPALRLVTINGELLREGDSVARGVTLRQITETGVIIERAGEQTAFDVLENWAN